MEEGIGSIGDSSDLTMSPSEKGIFQIGKGVFLQKGPSEVGDTRYSGEAPECRKTRRILPFSRDSRQQEIIQTHEKIQTFSNNRSEGSRKNQGVSLLAWSRGKGDLNIHCQNPSVRLLISPGKIQPEKCFDCNGIPKYQGRFWAEQRFRGFSRVAPDVLPHLCGKMPCKHSP